MLRIFRVVNFLLSWLAASDISVCHNTHLWRYCHLCRYILCSPGMPWRCPLGSPIFGAALSHFSWTTSLSKMVTTTELLNHIQGGITIMSNSFNLNAEWLTCSNCRQIEFPLRRYHLFG
jgi:hypothetical protein